MKLVLHIGMAHSGGEQLAEWAHRNADTLQSEGVWTLRCTLPPDHLGLVALAREPGKFDLPLFRQGLRDAERHTAFCDKLLGTLQEEVAEAEAAACRVMLACCPGLHGGPDPMEGAARLAKVVQPLFAEVSLVCFVRPHLDAALQAASVAPLDGIAVTRARFENMHPQNRAWDYAGYLTAWAEAFGREALQVVAFKRHDPVAWMRKALGLIRLDHRVAPDPVVLDISAHALAIQADLPRHSDGGGIWPNPVSALPLEAIPVTRPLSVSRRDAQGWHRRFEAQNATLVRDWSALEVDDLTPDWTGYPDSGNLDTLATANLGVALAPVISRLNAEAICNRADADLSAAELAAENGKMQRARNLLNLAQQGLARAEPHLLAESGTAGLRNRAKRLMEQMKAKSEG